ncbi:MAG: hypothetical protein GY750_01205 [Lentisphaerae bacterium]|nr:hypothetical protein [Lentisphaerota bacterium]MCP4100036.1 hypothetical protein [Lentisphaerota bacterium]
MAQLVAATYNMHKLEEYKELPADQNIEIVSLNDYSGYEEPEENGKTFADIIYDMYVIKMLHSIVFK